MRVYGSCCTVQPVALNEWHFCKMCTNTGKTKSWRTAKKKKERKRPKKPCSQSIAKAVGLRNRDVQAVK